MDAVRLPSVEGELLTVTDAQDGVPERAEWEELRKREIALAVADDECRGEADLDGSYERAYREIEGLFVQEHHAELVRTMVWLSENPG